MLERPFARTVIRLFGVAAILSLLLPAAGCAGRDVSFAALSDEQMEALFPTAAEVNSVLGVKTDLSEPEQMDLTSPATSTATPDPSPTLDPGVPEGCREVRLGTDETRSIAVTRGFDLSGSTTDPNKDSAWHLRQHPSAQEARRFIDVHRKISEKCEQYRMFSLDVDQGMGRSRDRGDNEYNAAIAVAVGDITMAFDTTASSQEEAEESAKRMAVAMQRRLQASAPK